MKLFEFLKSSRFLEVPVNFIRLVLKNWLRPVPNEDVMLSAIIRWVNHSCEQRLSHFKTFARILRFENVSPAYRKYLVKKFILSPKVASFLQDDQLVNLSGNVIRNQIVSEEFLKMPVEQFITTLKQWTSISEDPMISAIIYWISHSLQDRLRHFDMFAKTFNFENITSTYMMSIVEKLVTDSDTISSTGVSELDDYNEYVLPSDNSLYLYQS